MGERGKKGQESNPARLPHHATVWPRPWSNAAESISSLNLLHVLTASPSAWLLVCNSWILKLPRSLPPSVIKLQAYMAAAMIHHLNPCINGLTTFPHVQDRAATISTWREREIAYEPTSHSSDIKNSCKIMHPKAMFGKDRRLVAMNMMSLRFNRLKFETVATPVCWLAHPASQPQPVGSVGSALNQDPPQRPSQGSGWLVVGHSPCIH